MLSDGSNWKSFEFTSVAGVRYRIESSGGLEEWAPQFEFYGIGQALVIPMTEFIPPSGPPGPPPPEILVSLFVRPASVPHSGMVLVWQSVEDGTALTYWVDRDFGSAWQSVPVSVIAAASYLFSIYHPNQPAIPPSANPSLPVADSDMLAAFEAEFDSITQQLDVTGQHVAPSASPGAQHFWRIAADWALDSDMDGTPDWLEFELAAIPSHPDSGDADAFNPDVNADGTRDGDQRDEDQDAVTDTDDAGWSDAAIDWAWQITPPPRYAVFECTAAPPAGGGEADAPGNINDLGMVLYRTSVWIKGEFHDLVLNSPLVTGCEALGMNNHGHVIGRGNLQGGAIHGPNYGPIIVIWRCDKNGGEISFQDPVPALFANESHEFRAQSKWTDLDLTFELGAGLSTVAALSVPVGIKAMKRRELKVTVWHIGLTKIDGTDIPPAVQFTEQQVIDEINEIFGRQVNLWATAATVTVHPTQFVAYDQWDPQKLVGGGDPFFENGHLDMGEDGNPTQEQNHIANENRTDPNVHINVYLVGQVHENLHLWKLSDNGQPAKTNLNGAGLRLARQVWLDAWSDQSGQGLADHITEMLRTMSHEIGHVIIGAGHPDTAHAPGPAPLRGSDHLWPERLMYANPYQLGPPVERKMLVKGEWDEIEKSMEAIIAGGDWPPPPPPPPP